MKTKSILSVLMVFLMLSSVASAVEIRGTVARGAGIYAWTADNFAGFYYDINEDLKSENMTAIVVDRSIAEDKLVYTTTPIEINFSYSKDKNLPLYNSVTKYMMVGWQAENWVALNGKANKLVKLTIELKGSDKVTIYDGGTLDLGNGYVLKIASIDARAAPRQAWISIMKDGNVIDDAIMQEKNIYNLKRNIGGETDALIFSAYVSSIFAGTEAQMIQLQYLWFIDETSYTEVKNGDKFGVFEVASVIPITLTNPTAISLSRDSTVTLMGNMKFKVADSDTLRFYPFVEVSGTTGTVSKTTTLVAITPKPTVNATPVETVVATTVPTVAVPTTTPTPQIIYVTVTPTSTPVPVKPSPGFEAVFTIAGLIAMVFIVLRQKRKD